MMKTAEELLRDRAQRIQDAYCLRITDRIPIEIAFGYFPARYCGIPSSAAYYDYDEWPRRRGAYPKPARP